jgi:cation transport ATPase
LSGTDAFITASFSLAGMSCAFCARRIEEALGRQPGVKEAQVDFAGREALVSFSPDAVTIDQLRETVGTLGYRILEKQGDGQEASRAKSSVRPTVLRPYVVGLAAATGVVAFYLGLNTLTSDWYNARLVFREYGIWIVALAAGLGVQATLFSFYREWHKGESMRAAKCSLVTSGGVSTSAMAACCAHYLAVLLPALGLPFLSTLAAGLVRYQTYFFLTGVVSSVFGIGLMVHMMSRSGMIPLPRLRSYANAKPQVPKP